MAALLPEIISPHNKFDKIRENVPFDGSAGETLEITSLFTSHFTLAYS